MLRWEAVYLGPVASVVGLALGAVLILLIGRWTQGTSFALGDPVVLPTAVIVPVVVSVLVALPAALIASRRTRTNITKG